MTASSVLSPLQAAILTRLTGNAPFVAASKLVLDDVPEGQAFPYVTFGEGTEDAWNTFTNSGSDTTITMHIWSRYRGFKEAQTINALMIGLLDGYTSLSIAGYTTVMLNWESSQQLRDPDGITRHIATRFRILADAT